MARKQHVSILYAIGLTQPFTLTCILRAPARGDEPAQLCGAVPAGNARASAERGRRSAAVLGQPARGAAVRGRGDRGRGEGGACRTEVHRNSRLHRQVQVSTAHCAAGH